MGSMRITSYGSTFIADEHGSRRIAPGHVDPFDESGTPSRLAVGQEPAPYPSEDCACKRCEEAR